MLGNHGKARFVDLEPSDAGPRRAFLMIGTAEHVQLRRATRAFIDTEPGVPPEGRR